MTKRGIPPGEPLRDEVAVVVGHHRRALRAARRGLGSAMADGECVASDEAARVDREGYYFAACSCRMAAMLARSLKTVTASSMPFAAAPLTTR